MEEKRLLPVKPRREMPLREREMMLSLKKLR